MGDESEDTFLQEAIGMLKRRMDAELQTEKYAAALAALAEGADAPQQRPEHDSVEWTDSTGHHIRYEVRDERLWRVEDGVGDPHHVGKLIFIPGKPPCVCDEKGYGGEVAGGEASIARLRVLAAKAGVGHDLPVCGAPRLRTEERQTRRDRARRQESAVTPETLAKQLQQILAAQAATAADRPPPKPFVSSCMQTQHSCSAFRGPSGRRRGRPVDCGACAGRTARRAPSRRWMQHADLVDCARDGRLFSARTVQAPAGPLFDDVVAASLKLQQAGPHPAIAAVHSVTRRGATAQILVDHCELGTVAERVRRDGRLHPRAAASVVYSVCSALSHLHGAGLAHGSVRPSALQLRKGNEAKLLPPTRTTTADHVTARDGIWIAPELLRCPGAPTPAGDVWAVGCLVLELCTGRSPWAHVGTARAAVQMAASRDALPLPQSVPVAAAAFAARCLCRAPASRPSCADLLSDPWLQSVNTSHTTASTSKTEAAAASPPVPPAAVPSAAGSAGADSPRRARSSPGRRRQDGRPEPLSAALLDLSTPVTPPPVHSPPQSVPPSPPPLSPARSLLSGIPRTVSRRLPAAARTRAGTTVGSPRALSARSDTAPEMRRAETAVRRPERATERDFAVQKLEMRLDGLQEMVEKGQDAIVRRLTTQFAQILGLVDAKAPPAPRREAAPAAPPPAYAPPPAAPPPAPAAAWAPAADYDLYCVQPIVVSR
eukprot:TRINITY_DN5071_c1_g1_i1.p1 TRINITY_DN5071_c1_g1~~TRINITY_DN5071_c1_g1_i1.p1  ORF type:complete len:741 (+),score=247.88 TRINITY_DN5071_c1_g1_i1:79-2223(+)